MVEVGMVKAEVVAMLRWDSVAAERALLEERHAGAQ